MKRYGKIIGPLFLAAVLATTGCGQGTPQTKDTDVKPAVETKDPGATTGEEQAADGEALENGEKAMGRYVETMYELPVENNLRLCGMVRMEDGRLKVSDAGNGLWVSKDGGETWKPEQPAWFTRLKKEEAYFMDIALAADGTAAVIYVPDEDGDEAPEEDREDDPDGEQAEAEGITEAKEEEEFTLHPRYLLVAPDGTESEITAPKGEPSYFTGFYFSDEGKLYAVTLDGTVYTVDEENASCQAVFSAGRYISNLAVSNSLLAYTHKDGLSLYDLEKKEELADGTLEAVLEGNVDSASEGTVPLDMFFSEDGVLYIICDGGIYRHVIGGSRVERIADGSLSSLGNPVYNIVDSAGLEEDSFLVAFTSGKLGLYTFRPDIPAVPELAVKAYSLVENDTLKQAVMLYQNKHPESYIQYEVGMESGSAVTREDALKKLNTEIMAGKGPDFLLLDDMPIDSWMEKGILLDLTPYLSDIGERLLPAAKNTFASGSAVYAAPAQFRLPVLVGEKELIEKITDLSSLTEQVEALRAEKPEGRILGAETEKRLLSMLIPICEPAWKDGEGRLDQTALQEFLTLAKRIWVAEEKGLTQKMKEAGEKKYDDWEKSSGMTEKRIDALVQSVGVQLVGYQTGEQELAAGLLHEMWTFSEMTSSFLLEGNENGDFTVWNGQKAGVYVPGTIMGISAKSGRAEAAGELLKLMLTDDDISRYEGFPLDKNCLEKAMINTYSEDAHIGSIGSTVMGLEDGTEFGMELYWPDKEQLAKYKRMAEEMTVPYVSDAVLEAAVKEIGEKVLKGESSVEDGVREIEQKVAIYLSE